MTFPEFWHWFFTSAYTLGLEQQCADLKAEVKELKQQNLELARIGMKLRIEQGDEPAQAIQRGRPGRFQSFGHAKRVLENQPEPQRSVTV